MTASCFDLCSGDAVGMRPQPCPPRGGPMDARDRCSHRQIRASVGLRSGGVVVAASWPRRRCTSRNGPLGSLGPPTLTFSVPGPCLECSGLVTYALCVRSVALTLDYFQIHLEISFNPFRFLLLCEDEICRSNMGLLWVFFK